MEMDIPQTETMKGTDPNSHFLVIAKNNNLKLGLRPLGGPMKDINGEAWFALGFRLRVERTSANGSTKLAKEAFGIDGFEVKEAGHASMVGTVKVLSMPCSPTDVYEVWQDAQITRLIAADIVAKLAGAGAEQVASTEQIEEYLNNGYGDMIPNVKPKTPEKFIIVYGA